MSFLKTSPAVQKVDASFPNPEPWILELGITVLSPQEYCPPDIESIRALWSISGEGGFLYPLSTDSGDPLASSKSV